MKLVEKDSMPREVALELLTDRKARVTNRMRKNCLHALQREFISEAERKPLAAKVARKLRAKSIAWIAREVKRSMRQRRGAQIKYERLQAIEPKNPIIEYRVAALNLLANHLDTVIECCEDEIKLRINLPDRFA
jgi:hypothetical protein